MADNDHHIEKRAEEAPEKRAALARIASRTAENEEPERSFPNQLIETQVKSGMGSGRETENEQTIQALSARIAERDKANEDLLRQLAEKQFTIETLQSQLEYEAQNAQTLSHALREKETEVEAIIRTPGWQLLRWYGRFKYRYLLPIYKALRLPPYDKAGLDRTGAVSHSGEMRVAASEARDIEPVSRLTVTDEQTHRDSREAPYDSNAYDVVCFPIIDWDFRFQRPQQLMSRYAQAGYRVFYIAQAFYPSGPPYKVRKMRKNVYEISLRGRERNVYTDLLDEEACDLLFASLDAVRRDYSLGATVSFVQLPFWTSLAVRMRTHYAWPIVYDCMDHHAGFSTNTQQMIAQEHSLLASADLVTASSEFLEKRASEHSSNVHLVRNACEYDHFASVGRAQNERPVIGYYGAIADWFDSDLVADLAEKRPEWDFILVGSTFGADTSRLSQLPNVSLPGEKHYSEIPEWLGKFDVAIIPFKRNELTEATNPVKAYEILASGKPLVSVSIPEMASLAPLVRLASSVEDFESEITDALNEDAPGLVEERRAFAKRHTWQKRFEALTPVVRNAFPRASIIIVTFNNLALNRLCLESLYARTEWPNFEVIVVDNASSDETPAYLKEAEKELPGLHVILNHQNMGFAAGNNIGLNLATGHYLVLLNNDTVLMRGWLSALIRHLNADPAIGLICPVTNAIGNEAQIDVGYESIDDMPEWASRYIRENDGCTFALPMVAMFCAATTRTVVDQVGLLDERFGTGMFEDDDYNRRVRIAGYDIRCAHDSFVHHWQKSSFRLLGEKAYLGIFEENRKKFEAKWGEPWKAEGIRVWNRPDLGFYRDQLAAVNRRVRESKGAVIFLPSVGWGIHLFQRPHHLARAFAERGFVSVFDCSNAHDDVKGFKEIEKNLFLFRGPEKLLREIPNAVLWTLPYNFHSIHGYPQSSHTIYDWIDDLQVFPYDRVLLESNHSRGLEEASIVACVARRLHDRALERRPDALYLPNAVEYDHFAREVAPALNDPDLRAFLANGKPIAGYYGAMAEWFDYDLLDSVARLRPDWNFLLIGPQYDESLNDRPMLSRSNVCWVGPRPYASLPSYLRLFDVATIPFAINDITLATSPLKLYEYFAGGKAVIATPMPECQSIADVQIAQTAAEFANMLDGARERGQDEGFQKRVRALARDNSWAARVETLEKLLDTEASGHAHIDGKEPAPGYKPVSSGDVAPTVQPSLHGAMNLAVQFSRFRTDKNRRFFSALCDHLAPIVSDPCLPRYFEFAITCNERGREAARLLGKHTRLEGKRYLDVGCAYGGFVVAFAERSVQAMGIDIDESLLRLARCNLMDNNLDVPLLARDATRATDLQALHKSFDVVTCNDVIEHVQDPQALLDNISSISMADGIAYFEIPNRYCPRFVLEDGHYQLFGITLLEYPEAERYYSLQNPGVPYTVRHYLDLDRYASMFSIAGMNLMVLPETLDGIRMESILSNVAELRQKAQIGLSRVPPELREHLKDRLTSYLESIESAPRSSASEKREFLLRYGPSFWRVLGRKIGGDMDRQR